MDIAQIRNILNFRINRTLFAGLLFLTELTVTLIQAPWNPDAHHDGIMYGAAVGVSEGLVPNHGVFAQYGPLTPLLQGIYLHLTAPSLLNLRIFTAITIALIGLLIFSSIEPFLGRSTSFLISGIWTLSSPRMHATTLPWASFYSTLFIIFGLVLFRRFNGRKFLSVKLDYFALGVFLVLGMLNRMNVLGAILLVSLLLITKRAYSAFTSFTLGSFVSFSVFNITFYFLHALKDFYDQCIIWAFGTYSGAGYKDWKGMVVNYALYFTLPFFTALLILIVKILQRRIYYVPLLIFSIITVFVSTISVAHQSYLNPRFLAVFLSHSYQFIFSYSGITLSIFLVIKYFKDQKITLSQLVVWTIGGSVLLQLYPTPDPLHLWWGAPVGIIAAFGGKHLLRDNKFVSLDPVNLRIFSLIMFLILSLVLAREINTPHFSFQSKTLHGMSGTTSREAAVDKTLKELEGLPLNKETEFECRDGIYAAAGGQYLARNKDFVAWSPGFVSHINNFKFVFVCDSQISAKNYQIPSNWNLLFEQSLYDGTSNFLFQKMN